MIGLTWIAGREREREGKKMVGYFDGLFGLMFMRNSIKLLGSFWWGQTPCKCLVCTSRLGNDPIPNEILLHTAPPLLHVLLPLPFVSVKLWLGFSFFLFFLGVRSMASSSSSLRRLPFFFQKRYRLPGINDDRGIIAVEIDAILQFNIFNAIF